MMLSNRCSFSAHQRMHKNRPPHICPECGDSFLQASFQAHLREACLHFSRRVGYRCLAPVRPRMGSPTHLRASGFLAPASREPHLPAPALGPSVLAPTACGQPVHIR